MQVFCDVIPMQTAHLLLGRPWQNDRWAKRDVYSNKDSIIHNNREFTPVPLSPKQAQEVQVRLQKKESEQNNESEHKKECDQKDVNENQKMSGNLSETKTSEKQSEKEQEVEKKIERENVCSVSAIGRKDERKVHFGAKPTEIKGTLFFKQPAMNEEALNSCFNNNQFDVSLPSAVDLLLQEFVNKRHVRWVKFIMTFPFVIQFKQVTDLRTNPFQDGGNDMILAGIQIAV